MKAWSLSIPTPCQGQALVHCPDSQVLNRHWAQMMGFPLLFLSLFLSFSFSSQGSVALQFRKAEKCCSVVSSCRLPAYFKTFWANKYWSNLWGQVKQPETTYVNSQFFRGLTHSHGLALRMSSKCFLVQRDWLATRYHIIALKALNIFTDIFTEEVEHFHVVRFFLLR